jgi:hypothetical protein
VTYLCHGREVENADNATHYAHPSAAHYAADNYRLRCAGLPVSVDVIDIDDEERGTL